MKNEKIKKLLTSEISIIFVLVVLCMLISMVTPLFASKTNILSVLQRTATTGIVAIGMTFVIGTGGIDLSLGGQVTLMGLVCATCMGMGWAIPVVLLLLLAMGIVMGALNGIMITKLKMAPIMVTLSMQLVTFGLSLYITEGRQFAITNEAFEFFGLGSVLGLSVPIWIFIIVAIIAYILLKKFTLGRKILAVGSNEKGAWYAGINVVRITIVAYIIAGITASISAVIMTSKLMSASATVGDGMEMDAIAAVVIGGTSLNGGTGNIIGTVAGALIIEVITNWMTLANVNPYLRDVVKGLIILLALIIDNLRRGRMGKNELAG